MSKNTRTEAQRKVNRLLISEKLKKGWSITQIAALPELSKISYNQVYYDVKHIFKTWEKETLKNISTVKVNQLKKHEYLYKISLDAWENSLKTKEKRVVKEFNSNDPVKPGKGSKKNEGAIITETSTGDSSFLKEARENLKEQNNIHGIHAAKNLNLGVDVDDVLTIFELPDNGRLKNGNN